MAQLAEQLICNQQVIGSSPIIGFVPLRDIFWTFSSVGQSNRLITDRSWVRVPEGPFSYKMWNIFFHILYVAQYRIFVYNVLYIYSCTAQWLSWLERRPVTAEVESSSLFWVVDQIRSIAVLFYLIFSKVMGS